jgi:hypothetical protein
MGSLAFLMIPKHSTLFWYKFGTNLVQPLDAFISITYDFVFHFIRSTASSHHQTLQNHA